ncbi:PRC-barrel domain containing protein [Azospirillum humicireducens]|uniref:PRC-barrel domain containing protein n=1 Tax=Azospirillum humicireducens TaxID=1226968 RepID=A0A160JFG0_9PROT|nr:PRC-barrel domain-containing protein [Azospirillum humicireducens]ANC91628.1 PRC-barrel domain containing protein [Azospirillum humicireducens]
MDQSRQTFRPCRFLLSVPLLPVLALGACAGSSDMGGVPSAEVATRPPIELVGLTVQTPDGRRILGNVSDLVIGPANRVEQAIVTVGAPRYPTEYKVTVNSENLRYAHNRQAVILSGMSVEQFAALPPTGVSDRMMSLGGGPGGTPLAAGGTAPTNWAGATQPR